MITNHQTGMVDVRDLAEAHVNAIKIPEAANQRFLLTVENGVPIEQFAAVLYNKYGPNGNKEFPKAKNPKNKLPKWVLNCLACCNSQVSYAMELWDFNIKFDNSSTKNVLKINFRDTDQAILDCAESLKEYGLVTPATKK